MFISILSSRDSFKYLELTPAVLIKNNEFNEEYYEKLEDVENQILDGIKFNDLTKGNSENVVKIKLVNSRKTHEDGSIIKYINNELFEKIFLIDKVNIPQFIRLKNKFFFKKIFIFVIKIFYFIFSYIFIGVNFA